MGTLDMRNDHYISFLHFFYKIEHKIILATLGRYKFPPLFTLYRENVFRDIFHAKQ